MVKTKNKKKSPKIDSNIESRIKEISQDPKKNKLVNKLFNMFPDLNNEDKHILNEKKKEDDTLEKTNEKREKVFEQFKYKDKTYYKDDNENVWDQEANIVGKIIEYDDKNNPICDF